MAMTEQRGGGPGDPGERWPAGGAPVPGSDLAWAAEDAYWRDNFRSRPYVLGDDYERYRPAYRYGYEAGRRHVGRSWNQIERDLRAGWERYEHRGGLPAAWEDVREAVRDAWDRVTGERRAEARK